MKPEHFIPTHAPAALRKLKAWLVWRLEKPKKPGGKPRKVPCWTNGSRRFGQHGGERDRELLTTFDQARKVAKREGYDGVGLAILPEHGITALDFDDINVVDLPPDVLDLATSTYTELSPSGKGLRAFVLGSFGNRKSRALPDRYGIETFSSNGFVTFTGRVHDMCSMVGAHEVVARVPSFDQVIAERFEHVDREYDLTRTDVEVAPAGLSIEDMRGLLEYLPKDLHYDDWIKVGMAIHCETDGSPEGFQLWFEWSCTSTKEGAGDEDYASERWRSFGNYGGQHATGRSLVHMANEHGADFRLERPASIEEFEALDAEHSAQGEPRAASVRTEQGGIGGQFEDLGTPDARQKRPRYEPILVAEFVNRPAMKWIVKDLIPRAEVGVLFGPSGSGKSFAMLDIAAAIAQGVTWRGQRTVKGRVVYVIAEGQDGFRNRLLAYMEHFKVGLEGLELIPVAPDLLDRKDALELAKAIGRADLIILDTLAQVTAGGDENSSKDMGKALAHAKGLHAATKAMVMLVHHTGKDVSKGSRGWSGIKGAMDVQIEVWRDGKQRGIKVEKGKDFDDTAQWGFKLDVVNIGLDDDGDPITSCVCTPTDSPIDQSRPRKLAGRQMVIMAAIKKLTLDDRKCVAIGELVDICLELSQPPPAGQRDRRRSNFKATIQRMSVCEDAPFTLSDSGVLSVHRAR